MQIVAGNQITEVKLQEVKYNWLERQKDLKQGI